MSTAGLSISLYLSLILPCLLPVMVMEMEMVAIGEETMMIRETVDAAETEIALSLSLPLFYYAGLIDRNEVEGQETDRQTYRHNDRMVRCAEGQCRKMYYRYRTNWCSG